MKQYIDSLIKIFHDSRLPKSEKLRVQLFINVCLYNKFLEVDSFSISLSKNNIEFFLNNKFDFSTFGRAPITNYSKKSKKRKYFIFFKNQIIYLKKSISNYLSIIKTIFFLSYLYLSKQFNKNKNIKFVFEINRCRNFWIKKRNIIFISLNDLRIFNSNKYYVYKIKDKKSLNEIKIDVRELIQNGIEKTLFSNLKKNKFIFEKFKKENENFINLSKIITFLLNKSITNQDRAIFIDNSQGFLASVKTIQEIIDRKNSILLNCQHGGGFYEFNKPEFILAEKSPAYSKELIGFYQSKLIRPHYIVNGKNYKIKNLKLSNYALIVEGADLLKRNINHPKVKDNKYKIDFYKKILNHLNNNNIKCLIRRHPKSKNNWDLFDSKYFIEKVESLPKKYIPYVKDFNGFILVGLGNSLIYPLINSNISFIVIADPKDYNLSKYGLKLIKFLKKNNLLVLPREIHHLSKRYKVNINKKGLLDFSEYVNKKSIILENWIENLI